jgi:hypothetical protein
VTVRGFGYRLEPRGSGPATAAGPQGRALGWDTDVRPLTPADTARPRER